MASSPAKILVVDDTPQNVKLLADLLTVKGYQVVTAASGTEALAKIEAERPDLVLLDVVMPGMSGYDVCRKIRSNPATAMLPVVMVTALSALAGVSAASLKPKSSAAKTYAVSSRVLTVRLAPAGASLTVVTSMVMVRAVGSRSTPPLSVPPPSRT